MLYFRNPFRRLDFRCMTGTIRRFGVSGRRRIGLMPDTPALPPEVPPPIPMPADIPPPATPSPGPDTPEPVSPVPGPDIQPPSTPPTGPSPTRY
ncbi:MAG: hypothetical protein JWO51_1934 [Rhodospirillales bacterium]|nr:hypothetical protein [Rhodospirillales bacterium]